MKLYCLFVYDGITLEYIIITNILYNFNFLIYFNFLLTNILYYYKHFK